MDKVQKGTEEYKNWSTLALNSFQQTEQTPILVRLEQNPVPVRPEQNLRPEQLNFETTTEISQPLCDISNGTGLTGIGIVSYSNVLQCLNVCHSRRKSFTASE